VRPTLLLADKLIVISTGNEDAKPFFIRNLPDRLLNSNPTIKISTLAGTIVAAVEMTYLLLYQKCKFQTDTQYSEQKWGVVSSKTQLEIAEDNLIYGIFCDYSLQTSIW